MLAKPEISFFIPCLNEAYNIIGTLETVLTSANNIPHEIIVIDDGSTDETFNIVENFRQQNKIYTLQNIRNEKNRGLGSSYSHAIKLAHGQYFMMIPGDNVKSVEHIRSVIDRRGKADIIIPYFADLDNRTRKRKIISKCFTLLVNIISGNHIPYYNGAVLHKLENLKNLPFVLEGFGYQAEILCYILAKNITYLTIKVPLNERSGQSSAFRFKNIIAILNSLISIASRRYRNY